MPDSRDAVERFRVAQRVLAGEAARPGGPLSRRPPYLDYVGPTLFAGSRLEGRSTSVETRDSLGSRASLSYDGARDMWKTLGYPSTVDIPFDFYLGLYMRGGVAGRLVDMPASTTWRRGVEIVEVDAEGNPVEPDRRTPWETIVDDLFERIGAVSAFSKVDRAAGIGRYAVLVIGSTKATNGLDVPLSEDGSLKPEDIGFLTVRHEGHAAIKTWVEDATDPRFGDPETYEITFRVGKSSSEKVVEVVHASRILHVAENAIEDDVYGRPRLQRPFNRLADLEKVAGGSGEMFWANVGGMLWGKVPPGVDVETEDKSAAEVLEQVADDILSAMHEQRRVHFTQGLEDLSFLGAGTPDPSGIWSMIRALIASGSDGIPESVLFGTERGDVAKSTDLAEWHGRIAERQEQFAGPAIAQAFVDRLIEAGVLAAPANGYRIGWPPIAELDETEKADVTTKRAAAVGSIATALASGDPVVVEVIRTLLPELEGALSAGAVDPAALAAQEAEEDEGSRADVAAWRGTGS